MNWILLNLWTVLSYTGSIHIIISNENITEKAVIGVINKKN